MSGVQTDRIGREIMFVHVGTLGSHGVQHENLIYILITIDGLVDSIQAECNVSELLVNLFTVAVIK